MLNIRNNKKNPLSLANKEQLGNGVKISEIKTFSAANNKSHKVQSEQMSLIVESKQYQPKNGVFGRPQKELQQFPSLLNKSSIALKRQVNSYLIPPSSIKIINVQDSNNKIFLQQPMVNKLEKQENLPRQIYFEKNIKNQNPSLSNAPKLQISQQIHPSQHNKNKNPKKQNKPKKIRQRDIQNNKMSNGELLVQKNTPKILQKGQQKRMNVPQNQERLNNLYMIKQSSQNNMNNIMEEVILNQPKKKNRNKRGGKKNKAKAKNNPQEMPRQKKNYVQKQKEQRLSRDESQEQRQQQRPDRNQNQIRQRGNPIPYRQHQKQQSKIIKRMWIFYKTCQDQQKSQQIQDEKKDMKKLVFQYFDTQQNLDLPQEQIYKNKGFTPTQSSSQSSSQSDSQSDQQTEYDFTEKEYFQEEQESQIVAIKPFIIANHQGEKAQYKLPQPKKKWKIFNRFDNKKKYGNVLSELMKFEIIAGVNNRLNQKDGEQFQKQILIKVKTKYGPKIFNYETKESQYEKQYHVVPQNDQQHTKLLEIMIKGPRMGILIKKSQLPFSVQKLKNKQSTWLCFLEKQKIEKGRQQKVVPELVLTYIKGWNINENWEMVFLDLESIVSWKRQYQATLKIRQKYMINLLVKTKKEIKEQRKTQKFTKQYRNILHFIQSTQNQDQLRIIKHFAQKQRGLFLMQGPPGTGKTETICNYAFVQHTFLKRVQDPQIQINDYQKNKFDFQQQNAEVKGFTRDVVMICAQSNAAVNNVARKILRNSNYGQRLKLNVLRLGHTEEYDEQLLSINLPHLVETVLLKNVKAQFPKSSAQLRAEKTLKYELINKIMVETPQDKKLIEYQKQNLFKIIKKLVQIDQYTNKNIAKYRSIQQYFLWKSQIVLSTLNTTGKFRFSKFYCQQRSVRCLIIDEASQATEPSTLIPMMTNVKKTILVGDHKQLQPTIMSKNYRSTNFNRSLFERLIDAGKGRQLLSYQYRMVSELKDFSNKHFYQSRLKDGTIVRPPPCLSGLQNPSIFFDVVYGQQQKLKSSYFNESQCECVQNLVYKLFNYNPDLTIGVITPYKSQAKGILEGFTEQIKKRCKVSTVDAFQGQERDVIIFSCVRSNEQNNIGFVRDEKRMNVSITRAKYCLFVFGNADTISSCPLWNDYLLYHATKGTYVKLDRMHAEEIIERHIPTLPFD